MPSLTPFQPQVPSKTAPPTDLITPTKTPPPPTALSTWPAPNSGGLGPTPVTPVPPPFPLLSDSEAINFLLVGSDRRTTSFRTDTLIIVSLRPQQRLVTLISIPRDLYVYIPGWTMQRVNTAYQQGELSGYPGGGPALLKDTLLYNLGIRIDHVAMIEFDGFRQIVDTLGGIDVPLACPFTDWHIINPKRSDQDPNNWQLYTIGPGLVHMDGDLALWYARSRLRSSDFDRGRRQQEVLRAIYTQALRLNVIPHLPRLYHDLRYTVTTDLSLDDLLALTPLASDLSAPSVRSFYINRDHLVAWRTPQGAAVQLPDLPAIQALIQDAMSPLGEGEAAHLETVVEIHNGTDRPDLDILAAERLHYAGFETRLASADSPPQEHTQLYDLTSAQDPTQSRALLEALGMPASSLVSSPEPLSPVAYRLVLGNDYDPCFNPADLTH